MEEREQGLSTEGQARRRFLKQAGTVAWASPIILTMMSRAASAAPGDNCGTQVLIGAGPAIGCNVTTPCGSLEACIPDLGDPGVGNACICEAP